MNLIKLTSLLFLTLMINVKGQEGGTFKSDFKSAENYYLIEKYPKALSYYERLLMNDPDNNNLHFLCGSCYLKIAGNLEKAIAHLEKAVQGVDLSYREGSYKERNAPQDAYFLLARACHINNEIDKAIHYYEVYRDSTKIRKFAEIEYVNAQIKSCELTMSMTNKPIHVQFYSAGESMNREFSSGNPVISGNDSMMVFLVDKPSNNIIMMVSRHGKDWSEPSILNNKLGLYGSFFPVSLSYDGSELYLARRDMIEADIYVTHFRNGRWSRIVKLNKNINTRYYESHACISQDGKALYFTSNRRGGQGALDIYKSERESGDNWGAAINLGSTINTHYNEDTPFISKNDSKLYFSSQGHITMGGYDIFYSNKAQDGTWTVPENIGYPLSTSDDDLFYNPGWNDFPGYYSSQLDSASTRKIIYAVRIEPIAEVAIAEVAIEEVATEEVAIEEVATEEVAIAEVAIGMLAKGEEEAEETEKIEETGVSASSSLGDYYVLNSVMFDFDDYALNEAAILEVERMYIIMRKFPEIGIELTGHTDAKGSAEYNIRLSQQRAHIVGQYLLDRGISSDRIVARGIGELDPVAINENMDGSDAPKGRVFNRHVSIKINNLQHGKIQVSDMFVPDRLIPAQDKAYSVLLMESKDILDTIPEDLLGEKISLVMADKRNFYTTGNFQRKTDAMNYLNDVIDIGFPDARMIERRELEELIRDQSEGDKFKPLTFTIQVMALRNPVDITYFRNLDSVTRFVGKDGFNRYVIGEYDSIEEALEELPVMRKKGYEDAFIMSINWYERISLGN